MKIKKSKLDQIIQEEIDFVVEKEIIMEEYSGYQHSLYGTVGVLLGMIISVGIESLKKDPETGKRKGVKASLKTAAQIPSALVWGAKNAFLSLFGKSEQQIIMRDAHEKFKKLHSKVNDLRGKYPDISGERPEDAGLAAAYRHAELGLELPPMPPDDDESLEDYQRRRGPPKQTKEMVSLQIASEVLRKLPHLQKDIKELNWLTTAIKKAGFELPDVLGGSLTRRLHYQERLPSHIEHLKGELEQLLQKMERDVVEAGFDWEHQNPSTSAAPEKKDEPEYHQ